MRYMMLIYSQETAEPLSPEDDLNARLAHRSVIEEATAKEVLVGAEPLAPTRSAITLRMRNGAPMVTDGPFAETKEQQAGYIMDCKHLDEAKQWAARIPTYCFPDGGCIEIRPMPGLASRAGNA